MSTITVRRSSSDSVRAAATGLERVMLNTAAMLTSAAEAHMERRAAHPAESVATRDDARRAAAATVHVGLLPR